MRYVISYITPEEQFIHTFCSKNEELMLFWINSHFGFDFEDIEDAYDWIESVPPMDYGYVAFTISDIVSGYECNMGYHD